MTLYGTYPFGDRAKGGLSIKNYLLGKLCHDRFILKDPCFVPAVSVSVDVWTLVAISLERYFAICQPLKSRKWQTQCHAYKMIATVWTLSLILNSPILLVSTLQPMKGNGE